jgi:uncharacterized RDD family membrane protein YckC
MNPAAAAEAPAPPERSSFWRRLAAFVIDLVVVWVVAAAAMGPLSGLFPDALTDVLSQQRPSPNPAVAEKMRAFLEVLARINVSATVVTPVYLLFEAMWGRALGKLILGMRIAGTDARPAPLGRLLARTAVKGSGNVLELLSFITGIHLLSRGANLVGLVVLGGCFMALWPRRQALHDLAGGTTVYPASDVAPE